MLMNNDIFVKLTQNIADKKVFCFPYLGGFSSTFCDLAQCADPSMEVWSVNPPGHSHSRRTLIEDMQSLVDLYYHHLKEISLADIAFYGHSLGGVVAYFLAQKIIQNQKKIHVKHFILLLSATNPPCAFKNKKISLLSDQDLLNHVMSFGGIPETVFRSTGALDYFIPIFRSDFKLLEDASTLAFEPLNFPVYFFWGDNDHVVPIEAIFDWKPYFASDLFMIPIKNGGHFFIHQQAKMVADKLKKILK